MRDFPIRVKVMLPPVILALGLLLMIFFTIYGLNEFATTIEIISSDILARITLINRMVILSEQVQSDVFQISVLKSMNLSDEAIAPLQSRLEIRLSDLNVSYGQFVNKWNLDETENDFLTRIQSPLEQFSSQAAQAATVVMDDPAMGVVLVRSSTVPFTELQVLFSDFRYYEEYLITQAKEDARVRAEQITRRIGLATLAITFSAILATLLISHNQISLPISKMTEAMNRLTNENYDIYIHDQDRSDEIGDMSNALAYFRQSLIAKEKTEKKLSNSEARLSSILDNAPLGIGMVVNRTINFANAKLSHLLGYTEDEIVNKDIRILYPSDAEFQRMEQDYRLILREKGFAEVETQLQHKNGTILDVFMRSALIDRSYPAMGFISSVMDISELKKIESELSESQRALETLMANLPGMAYRCLNDPNWTMLFISDGCLDLTGFSPEDLLENALFSYGELIHPEDQDMVWEGIQNAIAHKTLFQLEYRIRQANGDEIWVWEQGTGVFDLQGELQFLEGFIIDITERKQAQSDRQKSYDQVLARQAAVMNLAEDLQSEIDERIHAEQIVQQQNDYLLALQKTTLELLSELDLNSLLENIVRRAAQLMETSAGYLDLVDPNTGQLIPRVAMGTLSESMNHIVEPGEGVAGVVWQTGKPIIINEYDQWSDRIQEFSTKKIQSIIGVPIQSSHAVIGVLGLAHEAKSSKTFDENTEFYMSHFAQLASIAIKNAQLFSDAKSELEERKRLEKDRQKLVRELEAKNQELESFVYTVSHDLKSPLVSISGFSANLKKRYQDQLDEKGTHYIERLQANVAHMEALITELLELSRVGRVVGEMVPTETESLLNNILETLDGELKESQAEVIIPNALPTVWADRTRLGQVFANLLDNAIKFRHPDRDLKIEIGCQDRELDFLFFVRDNGIGIDPRYADKIFVPFQKLNPELEGMGIGIALVSRIIEFHDGRLWFESAVGKGTTFFFTLPTQSAKGA
jgi:PAS domain S-box-containing protein